MEQKNLRILIIEDDEVDKRVIIRAFHKSGVAQEHKSVYSLKEAREELKNLDQFDCVFLDYILPDGRGVDLLVEIRAINAIIPVIVVTSQGDEKVAIETMKLGATDYIPKSLFSPEGLSLTVRNAMRHYESEKSKLDNEKQILESERLLKEIQKMAGLGSWQFNMENGEVSWSDETFKIFRRDKKLGVLSYDELISITAEESRDQLVNAVNEAIEKEKPYEFEVHHVLEDGYDLYAIAKGKPWYNEEGKVKGLTGMILDITRLKKNEIELEEARNKAEELANVKQDFLANMSHEIRTPMNAIIGFSDVLTETNLTDDQEDYVNSIRSSAENLLVIINDILDFSKIEAGKFHIESEFFNVQELLKNLEKIFQLKSKEKKIKYIQKSDKTLPAIIKGDGTRLNQILINLLSNAVKFTDQGSVMFFTEVLNANDDQLTLRFTIEDSGIGIPKDFVKSLFDSFSQASNNFSGKHGGTGLGLSIVSKLVNLMDGKIHVESEEGVGSTFMVDLPFLIGDEAEIPITVKDKELNLNQFEGCKILLAEDNVFNQKLALKILRDIHVEDVDVANNGKEALELIQKKDYQLVLMDIRMPEMDGITATNKIRNELKMDIPILAVSAHALKEEVDKCLAAGMNDYVTKPFKKQQLLNSMGKLLFGKPTSQPAISKATSEEKEAELDLSLLRNNCDNDIDFIKEMLGVFLEETPIGIKALKEAIETNNAKQMMDLFHKMKSQHLLVGAKAIFDQLDELETYLIAKKDASERMDQIKNLIDEMEANIKVVELAKENLKE